MSSVLSPKNSIPPTPPASINQAQRVWTVLQNPLTSSSLFALVVSTILQGFYFRHTQPAVFYWIVIASICLLLGYNYIGSILLELNKDRWLDGLRCPKFERYMRVLILIAIQSLLGIVVAFFGRAKEVLGIFLVIISGLYLVWDILIWFGGTTQETKKTCYRFILWDIIVLVAGCNIFFTSKIDPNDAKNINSILLGFIAGPILIVLSLSFTLWGQELFANWVTRKRSNAVRALLAIVVFMLVDGFVWFLYLHASQ